MSKKQSQKFLITSIGTSVAMTIANTSVISAEENPFSMSELSRGYMVAHTDDKSCDIGKCGAALDGGCLFNKNGELRCGAAKHKESDNFVKSLKERRKNSKSGEGKCGGPKGGEGKCGS